MSDKRSYPLTEALSRLIMQQPFFAVLLLDLLTIKEVSGEGAWLPTAGTDGKFLYINADWFGPLSIEERVFVLCHEVMHVILEHPARTKLYQDRGIGPDLKKFEPQKMNVAEDYIINDWIIKSGQNSMPQGGMIDPNYGMNDMADDVYCKLPSPPQNKGGTDGTGNWDQHMGQNNAANAPSKADIQRAMKSATAAAKAQGKMPGNMERLVNEICEPQVDWTEQLRLNIVTAAGRDDSTWARPNRKRLAISPHIYLPGTCAHKAGTIVIYGDTSGSVSDGEWSHYFGEMAAIVDELNPEACYLGSCDWEATDPELIESGEDVLTYKPVGGGGTRMPAIFEKLAEHDLVPDVLVILTDGYTDYGDPPPYEVIWVMTTDQKASHGKSLRIKVAGVN